jgi:hypothetical protein
MQKEYFLLAVQLSPLKCVRFTVAGVLPQNFVLVSISNLENSSLVRFSINIESFSYSEKVVNLAEESKLENKTDVKFDIRNFPNKLNQMLYYFTKMHLNLITDEM